MKSIIVLGMHRSATSLIAKGLHDSGVFIGDDLLGESKSNPWGHYEERKFVHLNDLILHNAGGRWDSPPTHDMIMEQVIKFSQPIIELIDYMESRVNPDYPIWGWKDPRTILTIRLFMPFLKNPHFVFCLRNPIDVAISLSKRDGMPINRGIALANEYDRRMIEFQQYWLASRNEKA